MSKRRQSEIQVSLQDSRESHVLWTPLLQWISEDAECWNMALQDFLHDLLVSYFSVRDLNPKEKPKVDTLPNWLVKPSKVFKYKKVLPAVLRHLVDHAWLEQCTQVPTVFDD